MLNASLYPSLTDSEFLNYLHAEGSALRSPIVRELVRRLASYEEDTPLEVATNTSGASGAEVHTTGRLDLNHTCPACEASLVIEVVTLRLTCKPDSF